MVRTLGLITLIILFVGCSNEIAPVFPEKEWSYAADPDAMGWLADDRAKLNRFLQNNTQITGLVLVHKGQIVFEYGNTKENSYIASCRKSILALLYGQYVQSGIINLDKTLGEMGINDVRPLLDIEKTAKIRDLLAAKSGAFLSGSNLTVAIYGTLPLLEVLSTLALTGFIAIGTSIPQDTFLKTKPAKTFMMN